MRNRPDTLMLFTAGYGTRMRPLSLHLPKPLIPVGGKPLLDHALALVREAGISRIVANTHHLAEQMAAALEARGVQTVHEPELLDTGGGLRNALPRLGAGPVFTMNADCVWTGRNPIRALWDKWDAESMEALLALVPFERAVGHTGPGDFTIDNDGRLRRGRALVYSGLQIIAPRVLDRIGDNVFSLNLAWDLAEADRRLFGLVHSGGWCDVGRPESIALAERALATADV